jgi:tight adherence protein C
VTPGAWGGLLGLAAGLGVLLVVQRARAIRRTPLASRVLPYIGDLPTTARLTALRGREAGLRAEVARWRGAVATRLEETLGGTVSIRRRIDRAGLDVTVHDIRIQQVTWGLMGFGLAAAYSLLRTLTGPTAPLTGVVLSGLGFCGGVLARDWQLSRQATERERRITEEFPTVAELLALAVAAGESPTAALGRVVDRSGGALSAELGRVLAQVRTGRPVAAAFDDLAARTGLALVARFAQGVAIAVERGTPLAEVLHAQAADVREAARRDLIESAARREVLMMVPVVFLVLPITVLFAFWPGVVGLSLTVP